MLKPNTWWVALLPLLLFALILAFLSKGLYRDPQAVPSALIGHPVPPLSGQALETTAKRGGGQPHMLSFTPESFQDRLTLINVFASWCEYCRLEHPLWMDMAASRPDIRLIGINYEDQPAAAQQWLHHYGNPYSAVLLDPQGQVALALGVYGTPETFVVDRRGMIRYRQVGPISPQDWSNHILPLLKP